MKGIAPHHAAIRLPRIRPQHLGPPACALALVVLLMLGAGCRDEAPVAPPGGDEPPEINFAFLPTAQGQRITTRDTLRFLVTTDAPAGCTCAWRLGDDPVSATEAYTFVPSAPGIDTLRVAAAVDRATSTYYWVIETVEFDVPLPPVVPLITAREGTAPGEAIVTWQQVVDAEVRVVGYAFAASPDGPLTEENWEQNEQGRVPFVPETPFYVEILDGEAGLVPGQMAWFYVRSYDVYGRLSRLGNSARTRVPGEWWLSGSLVDGAGAPVAGQEVRVDGDRLGVLSAADGTFRLGPLLDLDPTGAIRVVGSDIPDEGWCGFTSGALDTMSGNDVRIVMLPRRDLADGCDFYEGEWLPFFRHMTNTRIVATDPAASLLWSWPEYPVDVWVPDGSGFSGLDFAAAMRAAMATWNLHLGEEYLREAADEASADVICEYVDDLPGAFGKVTLTAPAGYNLSEIIPQRMLLRLDRGITGQDVLDIVTLHELGHVLGLANHVACGNGGYLMTLGLAVANLDLPVPIHIDELDAVRALRQLPQGTNMALYRVGP